MKHKLKPIKSIFTLMIIAFVIVFFMTVFQATAQVVQKMVVDPYQHTEDLKSDSMVVPVQGNYYDKSTIRAWTDIDQLEDGNGTTKHNNSIVSHITQHEISRDGGNLPDNWYYRTPFQYTGSLYGITYGNGKFIAVGVCGIIMTSKDGKSWTLQESGSTEDLNDIFFINGSFFTVGNNGTILSSTDGVDWTQQDFPVSEDLQSIAYGGGIFVAVGNNGTILTSTDGVNWIQQDFPVSEDLLSIAYGDDTFVAAGGGNLIFASTDGVNWSIQQVTISGLYNPHILEITYGNGNFVAIGVDNMGRVFFTYSLISSDGKCWKRAGLAGGFFLGISYINNTFVAVGKADFRSGGGIIVTSTDGFHGQIQNYDGGGGFLYDVAYGNNVYVAVGSIGTIAISTDAVNWTIKVNDYYPYISLNAVAYGNGTFVAVGDQTMISEDGVTWTEQQSVPLGNYNDILYANGLFIAVGSNSDIARIVTSPHPDSENWSIYDAPAYKYLVDITYGDGTYVAVGRGGAITSTDGVNWIEQNYPEDSPVSEDLQSIAYGGGIFVAVGFHGKILTSTDGVDWTQQDSPVTESLYSVAYGGGIFVAVGYNGAILTSTDGVNWIEQHSDFSESFLEITYLNDIFIAIYDSCQHPLITSKDGENWTIERNNIHDSGWDGITYGNNMYVVVGCRYRIIQSQTTLGYFTTDLWIRAVINTEDKGPVEAVWQSGGEDTTARGDRVIWGHFYASPSDVTWGSSNNPDLFVKIWFDVSGRVDVNYFHVSVPDIEVYSDYPYDGTTDQHGTTTMSRRYIRQYYQGGQSYSDENYEDGNPPSGYSPAGNPSGYSTINDLRIGSMINTVEKGPIDAVWRLGGQDTTARGDQVVWGLFYASPSDVTWGSQNNPDLFVKIWFDVGGRVDVNFFHVSVPDIEVYSDLPSDSTYDQKGTTIMNNRYIRHEYWRCGGLPIKSNW